MAPVVLPPSSRAGEPDAPPRGKSAAANAVNGADGDATRGVSVMDVEKAALRPEDAPVRAPHAQPLRRIFAAIARAQMLRERIARVPRAASRRAARAAPAPLAHTPPRPTRSAARPSGARGPAWERSAI
jgi:hypothetical protein